MYTRLASGILKPVRSYAAKAAQASSPETVVTTLPSGFRVATENTGFPTATIGVWIDAGSRYENERNNGTAHFLEHMAFKGTSKRTRQGLELEVENIGAHLNAYTSREQTVYYAKCFSEHLEQSVDILSDILLNSNLTQSDVEAERGVILREMEEVMQDFQEVVFDHLHTGVFSGNPLSMTILGPEKNIKSIQPRDLREYIDTHYRSGRMMLAAAGGVSHDQIVRFAEKYFGNLQLGDTSGSFSPATYTPCELKYIEPMLERGYGALVTEGCSWTHEDNLVLMIANTLIGDYDRSRGFGVTAPSNLALEMNADPGVQSFLAFNTCYKETGLAGVYFTGLNKSMPRLAQAIINQWKWLATEVDDLTVERGKQALLTNLLLTLDGSTPICEDIGRQLQCYGRRITPAELALRINSIDTDRVREVCQRVFIDGKVSTTIVGDVELFPSNAEIEAMKH